MHLFLVLMILSWSCQLVASPLGPISTTEVKPQKATTAIDAVSASSEATKAIGAPLFAPSSVTFVKYEDRAVLGPNPVGQGWLLRGNIEITREGVTREVALNAIIDSASGRLIAAFTDVAIEWPSPIYPEDSLDRVAAEAGWIMGEEIPDGMRSTVAEVLATVWRDYGLDPSQVGQIVARPRWITPRFPAKKMGDTYVPVRSTERVWIVQICGTRLEESSRGYFTQRFIQLKDGSLTFAWSFFLP